MKMGNVSAQDMLMAVSDDLRARGLSREEASAKLGYSTKQTLANILSSKNYLSHVQAMKFFHAFGYNIKFLTAGEGELQSERIMPKAMADKLEQENRFTTLKYYGSAASDLRLFMFWMNELFLRQNNERGQILLSFIWEYILSCEKARMDVKQLDDITERQKAYKKKFFELRREVKDKIEKLLEEIDV